MRERTPLLFLALTTALSAQAPLPSHARLEGEVRTPMLDPVANAAVELELDGIVLATTRSDAQGVFVFPKAPPGFVVVHAYGDAPDVGSAVVDLLGEERGFVTVLVGPARVVSGIVRDEQGKPVPGAWVGASPTGAPPLARSSCTTRAGQDGAYRLTHVAMGKANVRAWAPEAGAFAGTVDGTADVALDCIVDRSDANEVRFVLEGLPPNAQSLELHVRAGHEYDPVPLPPDLARPRQVEPGTWLVNGWRTDDEICAHFAAPDLATFPVEAVVGAGIGSTTRRFASADPDGRLRGRITDADGKPVAGLALLVQPVEGEPSNATRRVATTAADGTFVVQAPVGERADFAMRSLSNELALAGNDGNAAWFVGKHDPDTTWEVRVTAAHTVRARLLDANGAPAAGVDVLAIGTDGRESVIGAGVSDLRGNVCLDGLALGDQTNFRFECRGRAGIARVDFRRGAKAITDLGTTTLETPGMLIVHVTEANGADAVGTVINCIELANTPRSHLLAAVDRRGRLRWSGIMGSTYHASALIPCAAPIASIQDGDQTEVEVRLRGR